MQSASEADFYYSWIQFNMPRKKKERRTTKFIIARRYSSFNYSIFFNSKERLTKAYWWRIIFIHDAFNPYLFLFVVGVGHSLFFDDFLLEISFFGIDETTEYWLDMDKFPQLTWWIGEIVKIFPCRCRSEKLLKWAFTWKLLDADGRISHASNAESYIKSLKVTFKQHKIESVLLELRGTRPGIKLLLKDETIVIHWTNKWPINWNHFHQNVMDRDLWRKNEEKWNVWLWLSRVNSVEENDLFRVMKRNEKKADRIIGRSDFTIFIALQSK